MAEYLNILATTSTLAIIIDECLSQRHIVEAQRNSATFSGHVEYLTGKAIGRIKVLGRSRKFVDEKTSLTLYKTLMAPIFDYANVVYDCLSARDSHALQSSVLRIVLRRDRRSHVADLHRDTKLHYLALSHPKPSV